MAATPPDEERPDRPLGNREVYNVVTDVVLGPNVRLRDNVIQAAILFVALLFGAAVGALLIEDRLAGCLVGAFAGLVAGLLISGIFLMIYRAIRHARGKHD